MIRLRITWLNSPAKHGTSGRFGSKSVTISAMYFHSLRATVMVFSMSLLTSAATLPSPPG